MEIINTNNGIIFITDPQNQPPWSDTMDPKSQVWTIERTPGAKWIVKSVRHLTGEENHGNHHVYVDAVDVDGKDLRNTNLNILYGWEGMGAGEATPIVPIDKPEGEFGCNVPIFKNTSMFVAMHGEPSERVSGLSTDFGDHDGEDGNSWGHQSFHVVFVRREVEEPAPVQPIAEPVAMPPMHPVSIFVGALQWTYTPAGNTLPHHEAKISDVAYAAIVETPNGMVHARITTPAGVNLTPVQMLNTVDQAKQWIEQEAQRPQYHQESIA